MVKRILTLLLFTGLAAISLAAVEYGKLDYAAVSIPETDFKWDDAAQVFRTKLEIPAEGKYNLYFDMAAVERSSVTLRIDGKEIPALDLPGTARTPGRFLRIKLVSAVPLTAGEHEVEVLAGNPFKGLTVKALLAEKVVSPHRWRLVWSEEFNEDGFPDETFWKDSSLHWTGEYRLNQTELQNNSARWYLGYDSEYLYFKASFPDESICLAATDSLYEADSFELFILPEERYHTYVELVFSPDGRQYTRWVSQTTRSRYELSDYAPESLRSRTEKLKTGWSIEGRIGFRDLPAYLRGNPARPGETLRLMMLRIDRSGKGTRTVSTPVPFLYDGHNIFAYMKLTLQESRETKQ